MYSRTSHRALLVAALIFGGIVTPAAACGPFFPNTLLFDSDDELLAAPVGDFASELRRIIPSTDAKVRARPPKRSEGWRSPDPYHQTADVAAADLAAALKAAGTSPDAAAPILAAYGRVRQALSQHGRSVADDREKGDVPRPACPAVSLPAGLPGEFADYLRGAIAYHQGRLDAARAVWQALLGRPVAQRQYRSTWAAFMIGRTYQKTDPAEAIRWFERTRAEAAAGRADNLGLAAASLGWQGRAERDRKRYAAAIDLYWRQHAAGDPTAVGSLRIIAAEIVASPQPVLVAAAGHTRSRRVVTAYLIARGALIGWHAKRPGADRVEAWCKAIETAGVSNVADAGRLAMAAYQVGRFDLAQRWVKLAGDGTPLAQWIGAKLLLRRGKSAEAAEALARAVRGFPAGEVWQDGAGMTSHWPDDIASPGRAAGELALLRLNRGDYTQALDLLLKGGFWSDAAFLAERVLTPDELIAYVDKAWPADRTRDARPPGDRLPYRSPKPSATIRHLLARRLTRIGRWKEARPYYPEKLHPVLDRYIQGIRTGHDRNRTAAERAESFWQAARIARHYGMALLGTELDPDGAIYDGDYPMSASAEDEAKRARAKLAPATADEQRRVAKHAVAEKRFHYRYTAAGHAWSAAALMPDQSDKTARVLCIAGTWLKSRDPKAADRFYKALVIRCGRTELGRKADALRWFPDVTEEPLK